MLYVQLDTNWPDNPKVIEAGEVGGWLHCVVLCLAKRGDRDGWVSRRTLVTRYGAQQQTIDLLVSLALLERNSDDVRPSGWHQINLSSDQIRRKKAEASRRANHARWHDGPLDGCERCKPENPRSSDTDSDRIRHGSSDSDPHASLESEGEQQQEPDPAWSATERTERIHAAAMLVAEARAEGRTDVGPRWIPAAAAGIAKDHHDALHAYLVAVPRATIEELMALIQDQPRKAEPINTSAHLRPVSEIFDEQPEANWSLGRDELAKMRLNRTTLIEETRPSA